MTVWQFPPRESFNSLVSLLSRYGMKPLFYKTRLWYMPRILGTGKLTTGRMPEMTSDVPTIAGKHVTSNNAYVCCTNDSYFWLVWMMLCAFTLRNSPPFSEIMSFQMLRQRGSWYVNCHQQDSYKDLCILCIVKQQKSKMISVLNI